MARKQLGATPFNPTDAATKGYVDDVRTSLLTMRDLTPWEHLDALSVRGFYRQPDIVALHASYGYPADAPSSEGMVEVIGTDSGAMRVQRFTHWGGRVWARIYFSTTWSPWQEQTPVALGIGDVGGLEAALAGKIAAFPDPGADRIVFWDDSAEAFAALTASTGLTITGTAMTVRSATTSQTGISELATNAETIAGTDTTRVVTPSSLKARLDASPTWSAPSFTNGWGQFNPTTYPVGYTKINGVVYLRGLISGGTVGASAFTLPTGYRPSTDSVFQTFAGSAGVLGRLNILANGNIMPVTAGMDGWTSLFVASFPAA